MSKGACLIVAAILLISFLAVGTFTRPVSCWKNGDPDNNPDYGTHDWIAEHALDWLPPVEKQFIVDNLPSYLYGTEVPDTVIGDKTKHHVYYYADHSLQDDASAVRAQDEYLAAVEFAATGDWANAAEALGIMSHYISDLAVFGHVMGTVTAWGSEVNHDDYEAYVNKRTNAYEDEFSSYLSFDGSLSNVSAYDAALTLAFDTTFDVSGGLNCTWMDQNYNWSNSAFKDRCGESINLAVNLLADVLHTFYTNAVPEFSASLLLPLFTFLAMCIVVYVKKSKRKIPTLNLHQ